LKNIILSLILLVFIGCGYRPTIDVTKETLKGNVYIEVPVDIHNIRNSILLKEALIDIFNNKFNMKIVKQKHQSDLFVSGTLASVSETQLESVDGYSKSYRESVSLSISYKMKNSAKKTFTVSDFYDFVVDKDSVVSQSKKDEAIKIALQNALLGVPSKIAISSIPTKKHESK